jgi:hypothetical protein
MSSIDTGDARLGSPNAVGSRRLLHDLAVVGLAHQEPRQPARERLEQGLGAALARVLVRSLMETAPTVHDAPTPWLGHPRAA